MVEKSHETTLEINTSETIIEKPEKVEEDVYFKIRQEKKQELTERYSEKQDTEELKTIIETIIAVRMDLAFSWLPEDQQSEIETQLKKEYQEKYSVLFSESEHDKTKTKKLYSRLINQAIHYGTNDQEEYKEHGEMQDDLKWETEKEEKERHFLRDLLMNQLLSNTKLKGVEIEKFNNDTESGPLFAQYKTITKQIETPNQSHAKKYIANLLTLQNEVEVDEMCEKIREEFGSEDIIWLLEDCFDSFEGYQENTEKILSTWDGDKEMNNDEKRDCGKYDNYIRPTDEEKNDFEQWAKTNYSNYFENEYKNLKKEENETIPFWMIMEFRGIENFKDVATSIISKSEKTLKKAEYQFENSYFFTNEDSNINNITENGKLINWNGAMVTKNKLNALIHDYGQMKADAAKKGHAEFMLALDDEISANFKKDPEAAKTIIQLATIRSFSELIACMEKDEEKSDNKLLAIDELKRIIEMQ